MATSERPRAAGLLVGRSAELDVIAGAVDTARMGHSQVVWVEGDAGMGKTVLIRQVVTQLPAGTQVVRVQADELTSDRAFELSRQLGATSSDPFSAGLEILETWSRRQDDGPLAVVIEDLHLADPASSKALLSAVQRLDQDRVIVLITTRPGLHEGWDRFRVDPERYVLVELAPFDVEAVTLLASSAGIDLTPYQAERLHAHTGGHPLYVRTLLSELSLAELQLPDGDLPAPRTLTSAVTARLSETPETARALAAAMAVVNQRASLALVGRISGVDSPLEAFEALLDTGFVRWEPREPGRPVQFTHPLYRQAIYEDLSPRRRRDLHRAAAQNFGSVVALAHRVAAADGVDEGLAEELETRARQDLELGNKAEAARTFQWASSLSVSRPDRERRLVQAAWAYVDAGQTSRATALRPDIESSENGPGRSLVLGLLEWDTGHPEAARRWLQQVVEQPVSDERDARTRTARAWAELAEIHITLAQAAEAARAASQALALSSPHTSAERLASIHGALAEGHLHGAAAGLALLHRRLPQPANEVPGDEVDMLVVRATLALHAGLTHAAIADLRATVSLARRGFVPVQLARTHRQLGSALTTIGEWDEALVQARTGLAIAIDDHRGTEQAACHAVIATVLAYRGELERAETNASAASEVATRFAAVEGAAMARIATAAVALAEGELGRVIENLDPLTAVVPMLAALAFWPTLATALIDASQLESAQASIDGLERAADARGLHMDARLTGLRARLATARGELEQADQLYSLALDGFGPDDPYLERALLLRDHGRLQLVRGARPLAVATLRDAHQALTAVGATPFLVQVESDLKGAGVRPSRKSTRSSLELTDREHDVAVLVAKGYSNPEVAAELYVSRKAVEYHLGNIFGKLGITSRRELRGLSF